MSSTHITTCLLCPSEKPVRIKAQEIPRIEPGGPPPPAVGRYVQALAAHVEKRHPEAYTNAMVISQTLFAYMLLQSFETSDPGVANGRRMIRSFIHRLTRGFVTGERDLQIRYEIILDALVEMCPGPELPADIEARIMAGLRDLRDYLLEEGEYAPAAPEETAAVTSSP